MAASRKFVLIDPWLEGVGGHNYQYAADVLEAAEARGYETVLVVNSRFESVVGSPRRQVLPLFDYDSSSRYWLGPDGKCKRPLSTSGEYLAERSGGDSFFGAAIRAFDWRRRDRQQRIERYAQACCDVFERIGWRDDDIVFLPSLSEFDFLGLSRFLAEVPQSRQVNWHLQFHFNIFSGREDEYDQQSDRLQRFRQQFAAAIAPIAKHRLHFYATTQAIAAQYDRMGIARFEPLPYPVNRSICPNDTPTCDGPLRITCAGTVRREKGRVEIAKLIQRIREPLLETRRVQLVIQVNKKSLARILPRAMRRSIEILPHADPTCDWPIVPISYPLQGAAYAELIRQSQVGLFLYDARRYYARCSGVQVEMMAAGVPVIVPAKCWMAEQLLDAKGDSPIGMIADSVDEVPKMLEEMSEQYEQFRRAAVAYSEHWRFAHDPLRTVEALAEKCPSATTPL